MANSTGVQIFDNLWTVIATGASEGFFTNESGQKILYRENNALPGVNDFTAAHTLEGDPGAYQAFSLTAGQNVYARLQPGSGPGHVTVTLD